MKAVAKLNTNTCVLENEMDVFFIKINTQFIRVNKKEILFVEANGDYVKIQTYQSKFLVNHTMKKMESKLGRGFIRVHRSFIISLDRIEKINRNQITIERIAIPISLTYKKLFMEKLKT